MMQHDTEGFLVCTSYYNTLIRVTLYNIYDFLLWC